MNTIKAGIVAVQLVCLVVGIVQGWRYRHTVECGERALFPWLLIAMVGGPVVALLP